MATKPKKTANYDLKAADRKRGLLIRIGLTAVIVIVAVALFGYIVVSGKDKPQSGEAKAIRVASSKLVTKEGTTEPKVVLSLYEDFLCPVCRRFEGDFGPTIKQLIDSGAVAADYYMVAILDSPATRTTRRAPVPRPIASPMRTRPRTRSSSAGSTRGCTPSSRARRGRSSPTTRR